MEENKEKTVGVSNTISPTINPIENKKKRKVFLSEDGTMRKNDIRHHYGKLSLIIFCYCQRIIFYRHYAELVMQLWWQYSDNIFCLKMWKKADVMLLKRLFLLVRRRYLLIPGSSCLQWAFCSESSNKKQRLLFSECALSPKWQKIKRNQWPLAKWTPNQLPIQIWIDM